MAATGSCTRAAIAMPFFGVTLAAMTRNHADTVDDTILIEDRPWFLGLILLVCGIAAVSLIAEGLVASDPLLMAVAVLFLGAALVGAAVALRIRRLLLHPDGSATLQTLDRQGRHRRRFAPGTLRAAVQHHRDADGVSGRVMLLVDGSDGVTRLPFTGYFASPARAERVVTTVMAWRAATACACPPDLAQG